MKKMKRSTRSRMVASCLVAGTLLVGNSMAADVETYEHGYTSEYAEGVYTVATNVSLDADVNVLVVAAYCDMGLSFTEATFGGVAADDFLEIGRFGQFYWFNPTTASNQTLTITSTADENGLAWQMLGISGIDTGAAVETATAEAASLELVTTHDNSFVVAGFGVNHFNGPLEPVAPLVDNDNGITFVTQAHIGGGGCSMVGVRSAAAGSSTISYGPDRSNMGLIAMAFADTGALPPLTPAPAMSAPSGAVGTNSVEISTVFVDGSETTDPSSVEMTLNGEEVSSFVTTYTNASFFVSYQADLEYDAAYTAMVAVASDVSGVAYTNEWEFRINPDYSYITYVDITVSNSVMSASPDGPVGAGVEFVENTEAAQNNTWRYRAGAYGVPTEQVSVPSGDGAITSGDVFESAGYGYDPDNCPRLRTEVTGLASGVYNVYVFFWNDREDWGVRAGLTDDAEPLTFYSPTASNSVIVATDSASPARELRMALIDSARVTDGVLQVFVEDYPATTNNASQRAWLDGIGYSSVSIDTIPNIVSMSASGEEITLVWESDAAGLYTVRRKTDLVNDDTWEEVASGILGQGGQTTNTVPASTANQAFYLIEGE